MESRVKKKIVFICLGNICRSPLAEGIAREYARSKNYAFEFDSAGISNSHRGESPHLLSQEVSMQIGVDISHLISRPVSFYDQFEVDYFVAMDAQNIRDLLSIGINEEKILKIGDFGLQGADIPDPYYGGLDGFLEVRGMLEVSVKNLCDELQQRGFDCCS